MLAPKSKLEGSSALRVRSRPNPSSSRDRWRNLLFTTKGLGDYISGAILFEETLFQNDPSTAKAKDARRSVEGGVSVRKLVNRWRQGSTLSRG